MGTAQGAGKDAKEPSEWRRMADGIRCGARPPVCGGARDPRAARVLIFFFMPPTACSHPSRTGFTLSTTTFARRSEYFMTNYLVIAFVTAFAVALAAPQPEIGRAHV